MGALFRNLKEPLTKQTSGPIIKNCSNVIEGHF